MPSAEHVDAARAILAHDLVTHQDLVRKFVQDGSMADYELYLRDVLRRAVVKLFGSNTTRSDVIRFVAEVRTSNLAKASDINTLEAEGLLLACLGHPDAPRELTAQHAALVGPLCMEVVERLTLDEDGLSGLLAGE